jgi:hypothetical protein
VPILCKGNLDHGKTSNCTKGRACGACRPGCKRRHSARRRGARPREGRTNRQTDHEAENALDPVSGGPSPGVTSQAPLTAKAAGSPVTDMSGRPALDMTEKESLPRMQQALKDARAKDRENKRIRPERQGFRTPAEMGIPGAVVRRIFDAYPDKMEVEEVPNGHHFPETGRRYRLK